ncbi:PucR-like helix-turn-helix protein [Tumebacillus sp. BK434]|uniref:PucR family transcriptional regulator n=1 Tax=Tumebacillus sp. BK434 TaxID=2512169 RepID=UPI0010465E05|nr:PucR family transcriptional regulator [Tumebacillus sp. BK434]TCP53950.1 PucR-like helix-turn-helix protein [Tumebacillus sp. BK434]
MSSRERLAAALAEYGCVERVEQVAKEICYVNGSWLIPLGVAEQLRVDHAVLPKAVAELLALYAGAVSGGADARQQTAAWLSGERAADGDDLPRWLSDLGWTSEAAGAVVLIEFARAADAGTAEEATELLQELIEPEQAVLAREGGQRLWVLLPLGQAEEGHVLPGRESARHASEQQAGETAAEQSTARDAQLREAGARNRLAELSRVISGWIDTLSAELFLLSHAGVSAVHRLERLSQARVEAEFALRAGQLLRGKLQVHAYDRLGIARLLYGVPAVVRQQFVAEILPPAALEALTPELRETATAFVENGQGVAETARALFVHRNTLLYRLERIHELTGCDPRHPLEGWTLWLALLLLKSGCTSGNG